MDAATDWVTGRLGQALDFDGANDYVDAGAMNALDDAPALTISAWINPRSAGEGSIGTIAAKGPSTAVAGWMLSMSGNNNVRFLVDTTTTGTMSRRSAAGSIPYDTWSHLVLTWDGSLAAANVKMYVNGVETEYEATTNGSGSRESDAASNVYFGAYNTGSPAFAGLMDDVRLYNRVLTTEEVSQLYNQSIALAPSVDQTTPYVANTLVQILSTLQSLLMILGR